MTSELKSFEDQVQRQLEERADLVDGKPWGVAQGKPRIYLQSRRDAKVYVEFPDYPTGDETDLLGGAELKVFIEECGQHPNWYKAQRRKLVDHFAELMDRLAHLHAPAQEEPLHGESVTRQIAEALQPGSRVTFYYGGAPGDSNPERSYSGDVVRVYAEPSRAGTIRDDGDGLTVYVVIDDRSGSRDASGAEGCLFYTWRGLLRYGGGAEAVRM